MKVPIVVILHIFASFFYPAFFGDGICLARCGVTTAKISVAETIPVKLSTPYLPRYVSANGKDASTEARITAFRRSKIDIDDVALLVHAICVQKEIRSISIFYIRFAQR
ncbi:unnamed protein product [Larinioides sclopetarius]|uniref:Secreted protein n=1 Tax=Larinioides sclopetarius TaxID=280406 RepID=A0AAV1ZK96_9ARAC